MTPEQNFDASDKRAHLQEDRRPDRKCPAGEGLPDGEVVSSEHLGGGLWGASTLPIWERIKPFVSEDEEILLADGFEDAFVGIGRQFTRPPFAVYDRAKCIKLLMEGDMTEEEAEEFFEFNTQGAWVGPNTPVFVQIV